jgi:hypothetical protein
VNARADDGRVVDPQQQIERARASLLDGHGSGASARTVTRLTRNRLIFAGQSTGRRLDRLAACTAVARGNPDEIAEVTGVTRARLEILVDEVVDKINPIRALRARRSQLAACWPIVLVSTSAVLALLRMARRYRKACQRTHSPSIGGKRLE